MTKNMASGNNELGREQEGEQEREMVKSVRERHLIMFFQIFLSYINNVNQSGN
jgi:hypothetical protein